MKYIIVGGGISGSFLTYYLYKHGANFLLYDDGKINTASKIASGVINPVTGRRIVKTWLIDEIMPFAVNAYTEVENLLNTTLIQQCNIIDFFANAQMQLAFTEREKEEAYLQNVQNPNQWKTYFNFPFGMGETNPCYLIDINTMLTKWHNFLEAKQLLVKEKYALPNNLNSHETIIFCDGVDGFTNKYFTNLPYTKMKGEALIVDIPTLPRKNIYKHGLNIVPWKNNLWWVGSSYQWDFETEKPTENFKQQTIQQLNNFLKIPFTIVDHLAAIRPANMERRPFVGLHPLYKNIGVLNGMGTKGCSLAPYFANEFANFLLFNNSINTLANVQRFSKILSK